MSSENSSSDGHSAETNSLNMEKSPSKDSEDNQNLSKKKDDHREASPEKSKKHARFSVANVSDSRKSSDASTDNDYGGNCDTHQKTHTDSVTYNTMYLKSLRNYLTKEALPHESNYRNILSIGGNNAMDRKFSR